MHCNASKLQWYPWTVLKHLLYLQFASPQVQLIPKFNCCLALVQLIPWFITIGSLMLCEWSAHSNGLWLFLLELILMNLIVESLHCHIHRWRRNTLECFLHCFSSKGVSLHGLAMGGQMSVVRIMTESELQYFFFSDFEGFVTSLQLQRVLISVTGHCG